MVLGIYTLLHERQDMQYGKISNLDHGIASIDFDPNSKSRNTIWENILRLWD